MISKVLYWWCPSVVPECSCCVCLHSFVLLHTRTFHQEDPMLARTMTAGCGLALGLCWLLAGRGHRAAHVSVSTCVYQPVPGAVRQADTRHSPVSAQSVEVLGAQSGEGLLLAGEPREVLWRRWHMTGSLKEEVFRHHHLYFPALSVWETRPGHRCLPHSRMYKLGSHMIR